MISVEWEGMITFLGTADHKNSSVFYRDILGFELFLDQGPCRIYTVPGGGRIGFCTHVQPTPGRNPVLTFLTERVDEMYELLVKAGYSPHDKPRINEKFNIYHFFLNDPDGYLVELQKFL